MTAATLEQVEADLAPSTDQETQREIAEVLGITEVDVAVRTSHARAELTRRLGRQHEHQLFESRRKSLLLAAEYVTGAIIVGLVACKLATDKGPDTFIRGFAMLWFTAMALQFTSTDRRGRGAAAAPGFPRGFRHVPRSGSMTARLQPATVSSSGQAQPTPHPPDSHHEGYSPMKNTIIKALGIAAVAALATGCVSTSKFDEHVSSADAAIKAAQQSAAAAQAAADAASKSAASASSTASAAQSTANQALQAAQASQACCDATNEKIDRAFKKSMGK